MLETITAVSQAVNSFIWGIPAMVCIIGVGLLLSVRTGFLQLRKFPYAIKTTIGRIFRKKDASDGAMTPFQAVCTALAATVGTGNIAGVAGAIAIGGPGAVFWMWCSALLGMCTKFSEVTLAVHFRERNKNGELVGGPMYYIKNGLGSRWQFLAVLYSLFGVLTVFGTGNATQVNTIVTAIDSALLAYGSSLNSILPTVNLVVGVVVAMMVAMVLLGGVKSVGSFCEKLTPAMCLIYVVGALGVILMNLEYVPSAFAAIFRYAFAPMPAVGGLAGSTVALALRQGAARGTFSNEAGCGSSPITHATAITDHPFKEGMYGCFEVFVDTLVVCTMTALSILCAGPEIWQSGLEAEALTMAAFSTAYGSTLGKFLVTIPLALFAFSTMVGWEINYESAFFYVFPKGKQSKAFKYAIRVLWLVPGFLALGKTPQVIWTIVDIVSGFWCIPNAIALLALSGVFMKIYRDYESKYISKTTPVSQPLEYVGKD